MKVPSLFTRVVFGFLSLSVVAFGIRATAVSPDMGYRNYWGGLVFGPFTIVLGLLFLVVTVLAPERIGKGAGRRKQRR